MKSGFTYSGASPAGCPALLAVSAVLVGILFIGVANPAMGDESIYTARVPMETNDPQAREKAYERALLQVLRRMAGSEQALQTEWINERFPDPARYVMQFRPGEDNTLWVTLDGAALERVLRQAGQTVWGSDRPLTLVWLAVDRGGGEREIVAAGDDTEVPNADPDPNRLLRERIRDAAIARGVPIAFPLLDATELRSVNVSDIWGGFNDSLLEASRRYGSTSVLVGRIRPDVAQRNRWSYYFGQERREWSGAPEEAINLLADTLAEQFSISGNEPLQAIDLAISGIDSVSAYGAVHSFMQGLSLVEDMSIDTVSGDRILYKVKAHGGRERLERALAFSRILEPDERFDRPAGSDYRAVRNTLEYRYRP